MKSKIGKFGILVAVASLFAWVAPSAQATVINYDIFTDSGKTTYLGNGQGIPQSYGDYVTNFHPTGIFGSFYYDYGTNGGFTPNIAVEYQYVRMDPLARGDGGKMWHPGYGDLNHPMWSADAAPFFAEIRFVPTNNAQVVIQSFDWAGYGAQSGLTLKIMENVGLSTSNTLWSAGADGTVTAPGTGHATYTPNITGSTGTVLSIIFGQSNPNVAIDNIQFAEYAAIPEPGVAFLAGVGILSMVVRRRFVR